MTLELQKQVQELIEENAELAAQIERLKGAAHYLAYTMANADCSPWPPTEQTKAAIVVLQDVYIETQRQALEALKKQWMDEVLALLSNTKTYGGGK